MLAISPLDDGRIARGLACSNATQAFDRVLREWQQYFAPSIGTNGTHLGTQCPWVAGASRQYRYGWTEVMI
jgi:hypothetical protein